METKDCLRCEQRLPVSSFSVNRAKKDGLQGYCRDCMKTYRKEHYEANKASYVQRAKNQQDKLKLVVLQLKSEGSCIDCGFYAPGEPWLMEFDHREPTQKIDNIARICMLGSPKKLQDEIAKCDLLCVVCHRRRTAFRGGWKSNPVAHAFGEVEK